MRLSLIAAMDCNALIGTAGRLPWYLPADLKRFRHLTWGKPVIMGRKTWFSLPVARLPNRPNIVLTRTWPGPEGPIASEGCDVVKSLNSAVEAAINYCQWTCWDMAFIIGGASIFAATLPLASRLYLTLIDHAFPPGDSPVYFPGGIPGDPSTWQTVSDEAGTVDERNRWPYRFLTLERKDHT
jgi:dihydrofolate reductase